jgi:hypothetical protein
MDNSFKSQATIFVRKLIRMRMQVIKMDASHKNSVMMASSCEYLERQLDAYQGKWIDRTMAGFFVRNAITIRDLIPVKHGQVSSLTQEFKSLYYQAKQIREINQKQITSN